jgi:hypothetical protein
MLAWWQADVLKEGGEPTCPFAPFITKVRLNYIGERMAAH